MASSEKMENRSLVDVDCDSSMDALRSTTEVVSFVEKTHVNHETHLNRTLTPDLGEPIVASWAKLIIVSLFTKFLLACRVVDIA